MRNVNSLAKLVLIFAVFSAFGCTVVRTTGRTVDAVGEGAGHAVSRTGEAIERAADE